MQKKTLFAALLMAGLAAPAVAQDYGYVTLERTDGRQKSFALGRVVLTFAGSNMRLMGDGQTLTYPLADVSRLFFAQTATAIDRTVAPQAGVSLAGDQLALTLSAPAHVAVLAEDGTLCLQRHLQAGSHTLPVGSLAKGIYLVRVGAKTFKVSKP